MGDRLWLRARGYHTEDGRFEMTQLGSPPLHDLHLMTMASILPGNRLTSGRLWSQVAAAFGLIGVAIGVSARTRVHGGTKTRRRSGILATLSGLAGAVIGGVVVSVADGGPGSGSGIVGGYLALPIGMLAMALGGRALNQARRTDPPVGSTSRA